MADPRMMSNMFNGTIASNGHENGASVLPLHLIALIISYLDRPSDLGRMCRSCRVFHYMTLPQLYTNVSLRSYDYIRYSGTDRRPQGCGMASPFTMGLNGLVSRNVTGYVKHFELFGEWKEHDLEEYAKVGRVPDETMMLNTLVRVAVERMVVLDSFSTSGLGDEGSTAFMDGTYRKPEGMVPTTLKSLRIDQVSRQLCDFLTHITGLEGLYLIGPQHYPPYRSSKEGSNGSTPFPCSPESTNSSSSSTDTSHVISLKEDYLEAITKYHGKTLKYLLLHPQWRLTNDNIALIVRQCPKLEQLGIGAEFNTFNHLRLLVPFLPHISSIRLLGNPDDPSFVNKMRELDELGRHEEKIGESTVNSEWSQLRWMELGADDMIFEVGKREPKEINGKMGWGRKAQKRPVDHVKNINIWKMDSLEI
ncbi:hypothetical protein P7C71_g2016, partial [Lecanoromycetidae sp. Uapishka_2]